MREFRAAFLAIVFPLLLASSACSNQGEGERCDRRNDNADCASGLVCTSKETLKSNSDLCCPPPPQVPSVAECTPGSGGVGAPDASTGGSTDASTETDADVDAGDDTDAGDDIDAGDDVDAGDDAGDDTDAGDDVDAGDDAGDDFDAGDDADTSDADSDPDATDG